MNRRLLCLLLTAASLVAAHLGAFAQQQDYRTFYIYRNDGEINTFFFSLVDSMQVSVIDTDSTVQDHYVVQEVWTQDSVYRIPLTLIDSIGYQTPANVYTPDAQELSQQLRSYVLGSDSMVVYLSPATPTSLLPAVGTKLVTMQMDDLFPSGFMGQVREVTAGQDTIVVRCDQLMVEDVFERYYGSFTAGSTDEELTDSVAGSRRPSAGEPFQMPLPPIILPISGHVGIAAPLLFGIQAEQGYDMKGSISLPKTRLSGSLVYEKTKGLHFNMTVHGSLCSDLSFTSSGTLSLFSKDFANANVLVAPLTPYVYLYVNVGLTCNLKGEMNIDSGFHIEQPFTLRMDISSKKKSDMSKWLKIEKPKVTLDPQVVSGSITFSIGTYTEIGAALVSRDIGKVAYRIERGLETGLHCSFQTLDLLKLMDGPSIYERVRDMFEWKVVPYWEVSGKLTLLDGISAGPGITFYDNKSYDDPWYQAVLVPTFSNLAYNDYNKGAELRLSADVDRDVFPAIAVGFSVFDDLDQEIFSDYFTENYLQVREKKRFNHYEIPMKSSLLTVNKTYKMAPIVKLFNHDPFKMLASPTAEIRLEVMPMTDAVTGITTSKATLNGRLEGFTQYLNSQYRTGFIYSTHEEPNGENGTVVNVSPDENYKLTTTVTGLAGGTTYYVRAFLRAGGTDELGSVQKFTTPVPVKIAKFNVSGSTYYYNYETQQHELEYKTEISVKLQNEKDVADWGYTIVADDGQPGPLISLSQYGYTGVTDPRQVFVRQTDGTSLGLQGYATYADGVPKYAEAQTFSLNYNQTALLTLTGCTYAGTQTRQEYLGHVYDYMTTLVLDFTAQGAYWLRGGVGVSEEGDGWQQWKNLPDELMKPVDGANRMTVNYYYDAKAMKGNYHVRLKGTDASTGQACQSDAYVVLTATGDHFTGCSLHAAGSRMQQPAEAPAMRRTYEAVVNMTQSPMR